MNEIFKLVKLYQLQEILQEPNNGGDTVTKVTEPQHKYEIFELLYLFGMYYLQVYPEKAASFLAYCSFLTAISKDCMVSEMLNLDSELCGYYMANPEMNWSQGNFEVIDIRNNFLQDSSKSSWERGDSNHELGENPSLVVKVLMAEARVFQPGVMEQPPGEPVVMVNCSSS